MSRTIMLIPTEEKVGLTSIRLGVIRAIERKGINLTTFNPISQLGETSDVRKKIDTISHKNHEFPYVQAIKMNRVEALLSKNQKEKLMEEIISHYYESIKNKEEVVLVEALVPTYEKQFIQFLNCEIAKVLNADIILVMSQNANTLEQLEQRIKLFLNTFFSMKTGNISGVIFNKLNAPINELDNIHINIPKKINSSLRKKETDISLIKLRNNISFPIVGAIPWNDNLVAIRAIDIAHHLDARIINEGNINTRRIKSMVFCEYRIPYVLEYFFEGSLLVISADQPDILIAACLAAMNGVEIGAVLLAGRSEIDDCIIKICEGAFSTGLPVFMVSMNIWQVSMNLRALNLEISIEDNERIEKVKEYIANYINIDWIESMGSPSNRSICLSPPVFRYHLTKLASKARKRIVLPEGDEPRTVKAAFICAERNIATCVLLGKRDEINRVASSQGIKLGMGIEIIDPDTIREHYVNRLVELRKNKGISEIIARKQLEDNIMLGTMMLEKGAVDGLVSGAVHTTANTIRPSLQLIKTTPGSSLVSSIFFMLLPEQVYIYGDCAINPNPTAEQLAEIAIQSADSAITFGIEPRVAMLSYSTGISAAGNDVEKVREATLLAKKKRPSLIIDGPIQYDAAVMVDVAKSKAPNSPVAGRATVFIFPDLNTGNITYKAVQRSAGVISIGPMLQGMKKPVNDLSRGALINDIVYTIAITAIQAIHR